MKTLWLAYAMVFLIAVGSNQAAFADSCCGGKKGEAVASDLPVHGGSFAEKEGYLFETVVRDGEVRVYVFNRARVAQSAAKLKGDVTFVPDEGKKVKAALEVVPAKQGGQSYLVAKGSFKLPAGAKSATFKIGLKGLGEKNKGTATYDAPVALTPVVSYVCPMHADQKADDPGTCAKCKMALKRHAAPVKTAETKQAAAYVCPMHPKVTSQKAANCPKCGMKLQRMKHGG